MSELANGLSSIVDPLGITNLGRKKVPPPPIEPVVEMPDPLEQEKARERSIMEQFARRGRASTIMTNSGGTLGG